jgi:hypothetical protein
VCSKALKKKNLGAKKSNNMQKGKYRAKARSRVAAEVEGYLWKSQ